MKKAGAALHAEDRALILAASSGHRGKGLKADEAAKSAVADAIEAVRKLIGDRQPEQADAITPEEAKAAYPTKESASPAHENATPSAAEKAAPETFAAPEAFDGKTITQQVQVADTGKTATLRMDAGQALRGVNEREAALLKLKACMGR